jgi:hypothetical protein
MNNFSHDSQVITILLDGKSGIWKILAGNIKSITRISSKQESHENALMAYTDTFQIVTEEFADEGAKKICTLDVTVKTKRDFMAIVEPPQFEYGKPIFK